MTVSVIVARADPAAQSLLGKHKIKTETGSDYTTVRQLFLALGQEVFLWATADLTGATFHDWNTWYETDSECKSFFVVCL